MLEEKYLFYIFECVTLTHLYKCSLSFFFYNLFSHLLTSIWPVWLGAFSSSHSWNKFWQKASFCCVIIPSVFSAAWYKLLHDDNNESLLIQRGPNWKMNGLCKRVTCWRWQIRSAHSRPVWWEKFPYHLSYNVPQCIHNAAMLSITHSY